MKRSVILFVFLLIAMVSTEAGIKRYIVHNDVFFEQLSPYGEWIEIDYDLVVWRPMGVGRHWAPYQDGRWLWTSDGWFWDSYEPFGWATYHYGRWHYDDYYGWLWFPDNEWAPAWVEWRYNDAYVGWAPLSPYAKFKIGFGIRFTRKWRHHHHHWNFIRINRFHGYNCHKHIVHFNRDNRIFRNTKYRTNYVHRNGRIFNEGIDRRFVERRTNSRITERNIVTTRKEFKRGDVRTRSKDVAVYKPDLARRSSAGKNINIRKSSRSINIEKNKVVTRSSRSYSNEKRAYSDRESSRSYNRSEGRKSRSTRNAEVTRSSSKRYSDKNMRSINTEKRPSRKSSGRTESTVRESRKKEQQNRSSRSRSRSGNEQRTSRR